MAKEKYGAYSGKVRQVTRMPGVLLKIKGRLDSRKGKGVCDENVHRWEKKLAALEAKEMIQAENRLFEVRKEASAILTRLSELTQGRLEEVDYRNSDRVQYIRTERKNSAKRAAAVSESRKIVDKLSVINEVIIHTDLVLDERLNKIRKGVEEKTYAYIAGIRAGKLKDYQYEKEEEDNSAKEIYSNRHEDLDRRIRTIVKLYREKEETV